MVILYLLKIQCKINKENIILKYKYLLELYYLFIIINVFLNEKLIIT